LALNRWLKIEFAFAPLCWISITGICLFCFALTNTLELGSRIIIGTGFVLFVFSVFDEYKRRLKQESGFPYQLILLLIVVISVSYLLNIGMTFTVDDDYVYWGIIGKYLYVFDHLPDADTTIIKRHLAYTPGTSIFHYMVYQLFGKYNPSISYFSQTLFLISALFVIFSGETFKKNILLFCLIIVLMTIFSGSVFTKLQVDYLLSVYVFSLLWVIIKNRPSVKTIMVIGPSICFLFLMKEIGFFLGLVVLFVFFIDFVFTKNFERKTWMKTFLVFCFYVGLLFVLKQSWTKHCVDQGFLQFNNAMNWDSISAALNIFSNAEAQKGFTLFAKEFLIGESDRLNLPYVIWYLVLTGIILKLNVKTFYKKRFVRILSALIASLLIYLTMLYFFQIIVFEVGANNDHIIGFARYFNILFSPLVFFLFLLFTERKFQSYTFIPAKIITSSVFTVLLIVGISRIETTMNREKHYLKADFLAKKIVNHIDIIEQPSIGIFPGTKDKNFWIYMLYHMLPSQINHGKFPGDTPETLIKNIEKFDYVLIHNMDEKAKKMIGSVANITVENGEFYAIKKAEPENSFNKTIIQLDKLF